MNEEYAKFNKSKEFEKFVEPHIEEILKAVTIHKIPFVANFVLETDEKDTKYKTVIASPDEFKMKLKKDLFPNLFLSFNGGRVVLPELNGDLTEEQLKYIEEYERQIDENYDK